MNLTRIPHLDGDPGVAQTIRQMRRLISQGKTDPQVHELAAQILRRANVQPFDWEGEARAIYESVRRNLRFTRDVAGHETLHAAPDILRLGIADCDDFTILICSLLQTVGADCRIVTIATDQDGEFSHVYPEVLIDGRWIAMDAARHNPAFGKAPENFTRKRCWPIDAEGYSDMGRMGSLGAGRTSIAPGQGPQGAWTARVYPPFRKPAAEMTGNYLDSFPVAPPHQQFIRPPLGHGNYGPAAARRALGDFSGGDLRRTLGRLGDGIDWGDVSSALTPVITASTTGAANIIRAANTPQPMVPYVNPALYSSPAGTIGGINSNTLLLLGLGLVAVMAMRGGG